MASTYTPLLGLVVPTTGELAGTWGDVLSAGMTQLVDSAIAGTTTLSADADVTLSVTDGAANQARSAVILWTASNGATPRNITVPSHTKAYIVINAGTGSVIVKGAATTGVTIATGVKALIAWNGSDFVRISSSAVALADITGLGTGVATALAIAVGSAGAPVVLNGAGGTPSSITLTNATGLPPSGVTGTALVSAAIGTTVQAYDADLTTWAGITPGTGVATALAVAVGSAGAPVVNGGALGTPSSGSAANLTSFPTLNQNTTGTAATVTGATQASITSAANLVTVGALNSGSITSGFGAIDVGTDAISGGAITGSGDSTIERSQAGAGVYFKIKNTSNTANSGAIQAIHTGGTSGGTAITQYYNGTNVMYAGCTQDMGTFFVGSDPSGAAGAAKITSTGLNSTVIGATTPAAGSFTTLAASGAISYTGNSSGAILQGAYLSNQANANSTGVSLDFNCYPGSAVMAKVHAIRTAVSYAPAALVLSSSYNNTLVEGLRLSTVDGVNSTTTVTGAITASTTGKVGTTLGVGGATPSASGAGITFPATQSASTDPNTLDDYEEGTFTAGITCATSGTVTLIASTLMYTKVGRLVHIYGRIQVGSVSSPVGDVRLTGLPFAAVTGQYSGGGIFTEGLSAGPNCIIVRAFSATTELDIATFANGVTGELGTYIKGNTFFGFAVTYSV